MKSKILSIIFVLAILFLFGVTYYSKQTVYNDDNVLGNTSGNLLNGGLFCEYDGKIYFSNPEDEGRLYVMNNDLTHPKRLSNDTATDINVAGKYIIYGKHNEKQIQSNDNVFSQNYTGMYRVQKNGKNMKTLFDAVVDTVNLAGNTVYYQKNTSSGFSVYQINIDKSNEDMLIEDPIFPYAIDNGFLYYSNVKGNHYINRMNLQSKEQEVIKEGNFAFVTIAAGQLFFLDLENDHALSCMNLEDNKTTTLLTEPASTYNVTADGTYLYYELDNGTDNGIYRMNLNTKKITCLKLGNFNNINLTNEYAFFQELDSNTTYIASHSSNEQAKEFQLK